MYQYIINEVLIYISLSKKLYQDNVTSSKEEKKWNMQGEEEL